VGKRRNKGRRGLVDEQDIREEKKGRGVSRTVSGREPMDNKGGRVTSFVEK